MHGCEHHPLIEWNGCSGNGIKLTACHGRKESAASRIPQYPKDSPLIDIGRVPNPRYPRDIGGSLLDVNPG